MGWSLGIRISKYLLRHRDNGLNKVLRVRLLKNVILTPVLRYFNDIDLFSFDAFYS